MSSTAKTFKQLFEAARKRLAYHVEGVILEFTEEVVARMEAEDVSNTELAKRLDASPAYVTKVLRGSTNFTLETMVKIARALNADVRVHLQPVGTKTQWLDVWDALEEVPTAPIESLTWRRENALPTSKTTTVTATPEATNEALALAA
jgi:transcriptional regulator with XRE-family HTH domain